MIQKFVSKLSEKEKKFFYITILIVSLALLDRMFLGPVLDKIKVLKEQIAEQENSIMRDKRFLGYREKIMKESQVFDKYMSKSIPDDNVINSEFLSTIEKLATQSKVTLIKSTPSENKKEKKYIEYYANLDCVGKLKDVVTFMHAINATEDLLKVVKFNMTPKRGTFDEVNVSMSIVKLIVTPDNPGQVVASKGK